MMNDRGPAGQAEAGLCDRCTHVQIVTSAKGSRFYLCRLSFENPAFPRYPPLPVVACDGFSPRDADAELR
jgi:hypothetical protein